jgi:DNA-binding transcriptional MerR regulator
MNMQPTITAPLLTSDVARELGVTPETVRLWERRGVLPALKTASGVRLFARHDVERLARERLESAASSESR